MSLVSRYEIPRRLAARHDALQKNLLLAFNIRNEERLLEEEILASFERGEWKPVRNQKGEIARLRAAAAATLLKNKRVNIRISSRDLEGLQARAAEEGVPYQTLMASVLHKFVSGRLVETQRRITSRSSGRGQKRRAA